MKLLLFLLMMLVHRRRPSTPSTSAAPPPTAREVDQVVAMLRAHMARTPESDAEDIELMREIARRMAPHLTPRQRAALDLVLRRVAAGATP